NCTGADGQGGITATPCGVCSACTEIDGDRYLDYIELDAASNRGIDEIRDLLERAAYKPSIGRFKVFMIDEAHQLTKESFNALLKTLEEPPEYLKFVLATTDPEKMLPTVLSRCLQFNLRPMAPEVVQEHLERVLKAEGVAHDELSLQLLSRAARGSMRDGLSLADQAIAFGGGALTSEAVREMLGSVDRSHAGRFVRALAARDGRAVLAGVDALREHGLSAAGTLEELAALLQQMAIEQAVPGALPDTDPDSVQSRELAALLPADETQLLYSLVLYGRQELNLAPDGYAGLTMVLLRLLAFAPEGSPPARPAGPAPTGSRPLATEKPVTMAAPAATPARATVPVSGKAVAAAVSVGPPAARPAADEPPAWLDEAPDEFEGAVAREPAPVVARPAVVESLRLVPTPLGERWAGIVAMLEQRQLVAALVRELAVQAELIEQQDGAAPLWRLRVERESLRSNTLRDKLQAALAEGLGIAPLRLELEPGAALDTPARRTAAEKQRRQQEAEQIIHNDPLVQDMLAQFKTARIVPGSIKPH
ncbi:MAG TPA: DNA polymerase III subunit gamma/tau, partial [Burkholderiaceae bacterium]